MPCGLKSGIVRRKLSMLLRNDSRLNWELNRATSATRLQSDATEQLTSQLEGQRLGETHTAQQSQDTDLEHTCNADLYVKLGEEIHGMWYFSLSVLWRCLLGDSKSIRPVKNWVLVCCWWRFDWSFAHLIAPVVITISIILSSNKCRMETQHTITTTLTFLITYITSHSHSRPSVHSPQSGNVHHVTQPQ